MAGVTDTIKKLLKDKDANEASGADYVRGLMKDVRGQIVEELSAIRGETYTAHMLKSNLASIERYLTAFDTSASREMSQLLDQSWDDGSDLVPKVMREGGLFMAFGHIPGSLLSTFKDWTAHRIKGLADDAFVKIRGELSLGILGQKTPHEVIKSVAGSLDNPGIFRGLEYRAETIAKLEMGRAYSAATVESLNQSARHVPQLEKEWLHAGHPKVPRISHLHLHGQHVPVKKPFHWGYLTIEYPRSPKAPVAEVIHCGCEVIPWHPKWGNAAKKISPMAAAKAKTA